jgi:hypothetical protein
MAGRVGGKEEMRLDWISSTWPRTGVTDAFEQLQLFLKNQDLRETASL